MQNSSSKTRDQLYRLRATRAAFLPKTVNFLSLHFSIAFTSASGLFSTAQDSWS
jgi:hypothetical protein